MGFWDGTRYCLVNKMDTVLMEVQGTDSLRHKMAVQLLKTYLEMTWEN